MACYSPVATAVWKGLGSFGMRLHYGVTFWRDAYDLFF